MFRDKFLQKSVCVLLAIQFLIIGCGGHAPNPVDRYMPGDERRSCASLYAEIQSVENEIEQKEAAKRSRDTWNVLEFIGGILIIVPFFFMDSKGSHEAEIAALEARQKQLKIFFADKGCSVSELDKPVVSEEAATLVPVSEKIIVQCPHCQSLFKTDRVSIGKQTTCSKCQKSFTVEVQESVTTANL